MRGTIQATNRSKSGKTIGVQVDGTWYTSKSWELADAVGRSVIFEPSTSQFNGITMQWINDYVFEDVATGPAAEAMNQAMAENGPNPAGPAELYGPIQGGPAALANQGITASTGPNKDALIGAMALVKATPSSDAEVTWSHFVLFYNKLLTWDPTLPF